MRPRRRFHQRRSASSFGRERGADSDTEYQLWQRLLDVGIQATAIIRDEPDLRRAWLEAAPLESAQAAAEAAKIVRAFEADQAAQVEAASESRAAEAVGG